MMYFKDYLKTSAEEINQELDLFLADWLKTVKQTSPKLLELNQAFVDACQGGKRVRGALVMLGYHLAKSDSRQARMTKKDADIIKAGVAYEIFQTAILAHDDIIDKSDLRRGKPTLYKITGSEQTICLGDIGFFLAFKILATINFKEELKNKAIKLFAESSIETGLGEMLDVYLPESKEEATEADIIKISSLKTAKYTLSGPMQLGATLAGADQKLLDKFEEFGEKLGIAFQVQDDILGIFGEEEQLGKPITSDIEEGKLTLLYLYALKRADQKQKVVLNKYYGQGKIGDKELERIREIFTETGALAYAEEKAEQLVKEAKKTIPLLTQNSELRTLLEQMSDFLIGRNK